MQQTAANGRAAAACGLVSVLQQRSIHLTPLTADSCAASLISVTELLRERATHRTDADPIKEALSDRPTAGLGGCEITIFGRALSALGVANEPRRDPPTTANDAAAAVARLMRRAGTKDADEAGRSTGDCAGDRDSAASESTVGFRAGPMALAVSPLMEPALERGARSAALAGRAYVLVAAICEAVSRTFMGRALSGCAAGERDTRSANDTLARADDVAEGLLSLR